MMDFADLRVFEAVARLGSMNRAAAELHTVQSNVTARIRALEDRLGTPLFARSSQGVAPTPAARRLLPYVARLRALLDEAVEAARDDGVPRGRLRLGAQETTAALRLPPLLSAFAGAHPEVGLVVTTGTTAGLTMDVLEHRLDGALVAGPVEHPDLVQEVIFVEELMLATAPALLDLADLARLPEVRAISFRSGCAYRQRLESLMRLRGLAVSEPLEFGSLEAILGCVAAGIGVTLLPRSVLMGAWQAGRIAAHELPPELARVETVFVRRHQERLGSALAAFLAMARPARLKLVASA